MDRKIVKQGDTLTVGLKRPVRFDGADVTEVDYNLAMTAGQLIEAASAAEAESAAGVGSGTRMHVQAHLLAKALGRPVEFVRAMQKNDFLHLSGLMDGGDDDFFELSGSGSE